MAGKGRKYTEKDKLTISRKVFQVMETGVSCTQSCKQVGVPKRTFLDWKDKDEDLGAQYARSREIMIDVMAEDILRIADTPIDGVTKKIDKYGNEETVVGDMINHRRLQVDARKWLLSKVAPKKYGDRLELAGDEKAPLSIIIRDDDAKL